MAKILIILIYVMYEMIMFCIFHDLHVDEYGNRQEPYGCLFYCMTCVSILRTPCNCITLSLWVSFSCSCNLWWRQSWRCWRT